MERERDNYLSYPLMLHQHFLETYFRLVGSEAVENPSAGGRALGPWPTGLVQPSGTVDGYIEGDGEAWFSFLGHWGAGFVHWVYPKWWILKGQGGPKRGGTLNVTSHLCSTMTSSPMFDCWCSSQVWRRVMHPQTLEDGSRDLRR